MPAEIEDAAGAIVVHDGASATGEIGSKGEKDGSGADATAAAAVDGGGAD